MDQPTNDQYTNEWYAKQFRGMRHHFERCMVEEAELAQQVRLLRKEVDELAKQRQDDMAKIGELQERLDRAAETVQAMRKQLKREGAE